MNPNPHEQNKDELGLPNEITTGKEVEGVEKIPIRVIDNRNSPNDSFDLEKFLTMLQRLRSEGLYKISREFQDSDYGKYMSVVASSESDHWDDAIQNAKAIEIKVENPPSRALDLFKGQTYVEAKILMSGKEGRVFHFRFKDGKYRSGGWDDVYFQKRLGETGKDDDFTLDTQPKPKELE